MREQELAHRYRLLSGVFGDGVTVVIDQLCDIGGVKIVLALLGLRPAICQDRQHIDQRGGFFVIVFLIEKDVPEADRARRAGRVRVHDETGDMFLMLLRGEFAVPWADGVVVPLNTRWAAAEIVYALNDSNATLLLIDDRFLSMADAIK